MLGWMSFPTCALLVAMEELDKIRTNDVASFPTSSITFANTLWLRTKARLTQIFLLITQENYMSSNENIRSKKLGSSHVFHIKEGKENSRSLFPFLQTTTTVQTSNMRASNRNIKGSFSCWVCIQVCLPPPSIHILIKCISFISWAKIKLISLGYLLLPKNRIQVEKRQVAPFSLLSLFFLSSDILVIQLKKMHLICLDALDIVDVCPSISFGGLETKLKW